MKSVLFELEHARTRLEYYDRLRATALAVLHTSGSRAKTTPHDKWVEIYSERVAKLDRQATKLGMKTQLGKPGAATALRA
jgi:hypothetical protein